MNRPLTTIPLFRYNVLVLDIPWCFETYSNAGKSKSAEAHYDVMPFEDVLRLPVGEWGSDECLLFMWCAEWVTPGQRQRLIDRWGFTYVSTLNWLKTTVNGKLRWGTGYRVRSLDEPVVLAITGNPKHAAFPSAFPGLAREHSRKPDEFYAMVDAAVPDYYRRADVFARQSRTGWDTYGAEAGKFDRPVAPSDRKARLLAKPKPAKLLEAAGQIPLLPGGEA